MLTTIDNIVVVAAILGIFAVGSYFSKSSQDMESFYKANRSLPWSLVVGTMMASWYGGAGTIGTVGYSTTMGFAGFFIWSIGCHFSRFPLALWIGPKMSVKARGTMPELLRRFYGKPTAIAGALVIVVTSMGVSEVAATGYLGIAAWGANKYLVAAAVIAIAIGITCLGGLMGVAVTDMIFFFLMISTMTLVFPSMFLGMGGFEALHATLDPIDPGLLTMMGGIEPLRAVVLIVLCINIYKDPSFYQRFSAANSPKTGKRALLMCFTIFMCLDAVMITTGIMVRAADPNMLQQPEVLYVQMVLANLPVVFRGLFIVGVLGAIISTIDTYMLIGGEIIANDLYYMITGKTLSDKASILVTRVSCVCFGAISLVAAFQFPLVYDITMFLGSASMSVLWVPVLLAVCYNGKIKSGSGNLSMLVGFGVWMVFKYVTPITLEGLGYVDPVLIATPASLIAWFIGNQFGTDLIEKAEKEKLAAAK